MDIRKLPGITAVLLFFIASLEAAPAVTAFTYQGRLNAGTNVATGLYDFRFGVFDAVEAGDMVGSRVDLAAVPVTNGFFTVTLDFGADVFNGSPRWLQIAVKTNGGTSLVTLAPRQALNAAPYAVYAPGAGTAALANSVAAGAVTTAGIANGAVTGSKIAAGALPSVLIDDGGAAAYADLIESSEFLSPGTALPFETLSLVVTNSAAPSLTFTLDGSAFGTVASFVGREAMSEPYQFVVEVIAASASLNTGAQMGRQGRLTFARNGRSTSFAGLVTGCSVASYGGTNALYTFRLEPPLAWMALSTDYRIYQEEDVPTLVGSLYQAVTSNSLNSSLSGSYSPRSSVIQFAETDLNFISRLLEDEGISYFFQQGAGAPTLVLGDSASSYLTAPNGPFSYYGNLATNIPSGTECLRTFHKSTRESTRTSQIKSYDFTKPATDTTGEKSGAAGLGEQYHFGSSGSSKSVNEVLAQVRLDRFGIERATIVGRANAPDLRPGYKFTLNDLSGAGVGGDYLITAVRHSAFRRLTNGVVSFYYGNEFEVVSATLHYRPALKSAKPTLHPCTAVVTGPATEEIWTDKYGRVKVQFHWDRYGAGDEHSSGWVRVASQWAGQNWGMIAIPRIGQEVLVDFANGDSVEPVITGSLYNGTQMPPYDLPANATQSGIKSRSSKGGTFANYNEVRFEDKKGSEQVLIHAEKDLTLEVENDMTSWVGHDLTSTVDHDLTATVKHDLTLSVWNNLSLTASQGIGINTGNDPAIALKVGGTVAATTFQGSGAGLTNVPASALTGSINDARLSANVAMLNSEANFLGPVGIGTYADSAMLTLGGNVRLNNNELLLRGSGDFNHGLGWYGSGKLFAGVNLDGPVLYGCDGGGLGTGCGSVLALRWRNDGNVMIDPTSANAGALLPGLTFGSFSGEGIASKRTAGGNQYGLDFYTYGTNRLSITQTGNVGIGKTNPTVLLDVAGPIRATGTIRSGTETGGAPASYPTGSDGLLVRRVRSVAPSAGNVVARTDKLTLERDGTSSGLRLVYPAAPGRQVVNCFGINTNGTTVVYRSTLTNPATAGALTLFADAQRIVHYDISFGDPYSTAPAHLTHVVMDRFDDGATSDSYMVGTITSSYNQ